MFGQTLKDLRLAKGLSLREVCRLTGYDPSNWSKIERGILPPPSDEQVLKKWADILGMGKNQEAGQKFIDEAKVVQGAVPSDILSQPAVQCLPAFFRTLRNKKPTKEEIDRILNLIKNA